MNNVERMARNMVGDRHDPNIFFLSISNDYMYFYNDNFLDWIGDLIPSFKSIGSTIKKYTTYEKAKKAAKEIFGSKQDHGKEHFVVNRSTIEDRHSGTVFEIVKCFDPQTAETWVETREDYYRFEQWDKERKVA